MVSGTTSARLIACFVCLAAAAGCATHKADNIAAKLAGRSYVDVEACLGLPAKTGRADDKSLIVEWASDQHGATASIPLANLALLPVTLPLSMAGNISLGGDTSCVAVGRVVNGHMVSLRYHGPSGTILGGADAACVAVVRGRE